MMSAGQSAHLCRPNSAYWGQDAYRGGDYFTKVQSYLIPPEWKRRLSWIRFAEDPAVYVRCEEVIHSRTLWWTVCSLKTIIRSSQSIQSEIRARVYGKISANAILTFNFFSGRSASNGILLVRLSGEGRRGGWGIILGKLLLLRACWDERQDVAGPLCLTVGLFCPLLHPRRNCNSSGRVDYSEGIPIGWISYS